MRYFRQMTALLTPLWGILGTILETLPTSAFYVGETTKYIPLFVEIRIKTEYFSDENV
jgi:hypothetical protein